MADPAVTDNSNCDLLMLEHGLMATFQNHHDELLGLVQLPKAIVVLAPITGSSGLLDSPEHFHPVSEINIKLKACWYDLHGFLSKR
jgi:hypothetical protein